MKKIIPILLFLAMCGGIVFFDYLLKTYWPEKETVSEYDEGYDYGYTAGYEWGYDEGRDEGYNEAMRDAPEKVKNYVENDVWDLDSDINREWGMYPEDAVQVLTNYLDGEPITEEQLNNAIWAIHQYYNGMAEIVSDIDDYWID